MDENTTDSKIIMLQTKVSPEVYARLESICKKYGFTIFLLLRMLAECIIRFMDDEHNLSEDLTRIMRMFEGLPGWRKSICLTDTEQEIGIVEAFYVLRAKGQEGFRLVHVERPMMDGDESGWTASYNIQFMLDRFIEVINPSLYRHLRQLSADLGTESMFDTIHTIANLYKENPDETELRLQFENNDWHQGAKMHDQTKYQRHHTHGMDYIEKQQPKLFDDHEQQ